MRVFRILLVTLTGIVSCFLFPFSISIVAAEDSKNLSPEAFVNKFNMRTIFSSYGPRLKYYCDTYPVEYFSIINYVSETELDLYDGSDYWSVRFEEGNRIILYNRIRDASYRSQKSYQLVYFESLDEWRADETRNERLDDCEPFELERQVSFGNGHYKFEKLTTYLDNYDPGYVKLGNGEEVQVGFESISWEEVEAWSSGKHVSVVYEPDSGMRLRDLESNRTIPAYFYSGESPLDQIEDACIEIASDTLEHAECYKASLQAWDTELNQNYRSLMSRLDDQEKSKVRAAQRQWIEYRDAQLEAVSLISNRPGTVWTIRAASIAAGITKDQAVRLGNLIP
ncbi:lysozyme inhibitor LprI family protein [Marinobacter sp.]|uniref:lysozyme inhibitor LprI family protein n=1 Tax=Marinobacter sp. TaxID=50741 RepID=UPI0035C769EC